ncbi:MFS transporter [Actinoplanes oblitus]|uniref:MFS transporter n=1 Tax=Actinoplanes oblitus TaxID=3040509 RepID=A0ABY8WBR4_9ACTN|nr:MFS transporter [Actinoplanes oblitus]WIM94518.1 MFS transporter [Actinoplanes oblitus]
MKPARVVAHLLTAQAINGFGDGLWFSIWAIFFTHVQHIPAGQMGLAVGLGGAVGLLAAVPMGVLADRHGSREVLGVVIVLRGLAMAAYVFVTGFWSLLLVTICFHAVRSSGAGIRVALIYGLMPEEQRLRVLAQSRVVQHIAYAVGAAGGAIVLAVDREWIYLAAVLINAATFLVTAYFTVRVPRVPAVPADRRHGSTQAVRDFPYVSIMLATAVLAFCWSMLSSGLPLWITTHTTAGAWVAAVAVALSSILIAAFQVRVTRGVTGIPRAVGAARFAGLLLAASCAVFALAALPSNPVLATVVILLGVCANVVGELYYVASRWALSLGLMMRDAEGQYQGVQASTEAIAVAVGPAVVTGLVTGMAGVGWLVLGAILVVAVAPLRVLAARTMRNPERVAAAAARDEAGREPALKET